MVIKWRCRSTCYAFSKQFSTKRWKCIIFVMDVFKVGGLNIKQRLGHQNNLWCGSLPAGCLATVHRYIREECFGIKYEKYDDIWSHLTHWRRDKMAAIFQTTFSNTFPWMKMYEFRLRFHCSLFPMVQLTIFQHWFRWWLGADQGTNHYLNQWWLVYWHIYVSRAFNELNQMALAAFYVFFLRVQRVPDSNMSITRG